MEIGPKGAKFFDADRRTDKHAEATEPHRQARRNY